MGGIHLIYLLMMTLIIGDPILKLNDIEKGI